MPQRQSSNHGPNAPRIESLDALRGLAVLVWLLAVVAGSVLQRAPKNALRDTLVAEFTPSFWNGVTANDLVLPMFLFTAGASIAPAFAKRRQMGTTNRQLAARILRRMVLLIGIGLVCEGGLFQHWPHIRIVGAFQRIAICYAVAACLEVTTEWRFQTGLLAFLLISYWAILAFSGSASDAIGAYSLENNAAANVDKLLLPGRKYFANWDPQGILTTIPALAVTIAGLLVGKVLVAGRLSAKEHVKQRDWTVWLICIGVAAMNLGFLWGFLVPLNPHLWTSSYCVTAIGIGLAILGTIDLVLSISAWTGWAKPLTVFGGNAARHNPVGGRTFARCSGLCNCLANA